MAQYTNQAQLTYGNTVTSSNIAVGEVVSTLSITKVAIRQDYQQNDTVTYIISLVNSGASAVNDLDVTDNLGEYTFGIGTLTPLTYIDGTLLYYLNGVLQPTPSVTSSDNLVITGINIPPRSNALLIYEARVNSFAPLNADGEITNTATVVGECASTVTASETITASTAPNLTITKSISPVPVACGDTVTYTFIIQNTGNGALVATDDAVVTDIFNPALSGVNATLDGTPIGFTYDEATGAFSTTPGAITVPPATITQDLTTGEWTVTPSTVSLVVTGAIE
ncbi:MAG: DUF11 domain-containing protein [Clostridia bacterium]|nr:DUF11 domain-containing protein [Clostridia bacterium]